MPEHMRKLKQEYDSNIGPDDIRVRSEVQDFMKEYRAQDPIRVPDEEPPTLFTSNMDEFTPLSHREYAERRPAPPLTVEDSAKFGNAPAYPPKQ